MSNCNKCPSFSKIDTEIKRQHDLDLAYKQRLQNISSLVKKQNNLWSKLTSNKTSQTNKQYSKKN
jgi:hypothetical protein